MITQQYIEYFKTTHNYKILSEGLQRGELDKVILGQNPYRITSEFEMEDTIPSQVLICIHILIQENKLSSETVNEAFLKIPISANYVCLLLNYLDTYLVYLKDNNEFKLDYNVIYEKVKKLKNEFQQYNCFNNLMATIKNKIS